ncbi:MAG: AAA family ATPase, partial [Pseudomonadota bacterium]
SVLRLADSMNSRVILVGDTRQHSAVSRGDAMRLIENEAGIRPAEIHEVMRQSGDYKRAITAIASGDVLYGFDLLDKQKAIIEQPDAGARYHQLIDEVLAGALDETLVVAPTNREAETVTSLMRHELKKRGALGTEDTPCRTLKNLNWTEAQRTDQAQYRDGMVLVFHQRANGVAIGEQLTITGLSVDSVPLARNRAGQTVRVPIDQPSRFSVFEERTLGIAPGDMIRMKRGSRTKDRKHELMNGRSYCVKAVRNNGDIELQNGWVVDKDFGGFDYGYVTTSYSSQGRTVNRVFVAEDSHSGRAASTEQFYVSASRGRREVKIFTDNKDALKESIQRSAARPSATELMQGMVTGDLKPKSRNDTMRAYGAWMRHHMRVKQQNPQFVAGRSDDLVQEARRDAFRSMGVDR